MRAGKSRTMAKIISTQLRSRNILGSPERKRYVPYIFLEGNSCFTADILLLPNYDAIRCTEVGVVGYVLLLTPCAGGHVSVAAGSRSGCVAERRPRPVHTAPFHTCEDRVQTTEEGTAGEDVRRVGGDHASNSEDTEIDEDNHIGVRIFGGDDDVADAHATDRCRKRIRTSTP